MSTTDLPVVVIGAGPSGLAAAAHLRERGLEPLVLEAGGHAAAAVRQWAHIRLFSPWSELVDGAAERLLAARGWTAPDATTCPTGGEWAEHYLDPLANALGDAVRLGVTVTGVARTGRDRLVDAGRDDTGFTVHVIGPDGPARIAARAVIDASGTWHGPNPLGGDGLPALGEREASDRITYRVPVLEGADRDRYAGKHVVVAGTGASAKTVLIALANLLEHARGTRVTWLVRRASAAGAFGGGEADELPARGALGTRAQAAVDAGGVVTVTGFRTSEVVRAGDALTLRSVDGQVVEDVDEVVALTGFRPDLSMLTELRLDLDPVLQAPRRLAPLIDPNVHSCGSVPPHGAAELSHPEPGFYLVGMKSYGRATSFLTLTGYEQVRSVVAEIAGDHDAAGRVELTLPETGVCGGAGAYDGSGGGCCSPEPEVLTIGVPA